MKIVVLIENSPGPAGTTCEHGLSIYIETKNHAVLMDTGASDAICRNAHALGVDLRKVDTVVISHGHYDHAGGLMAFSEINPEASIYMQASASGNFFSDDRYIGINRDILKLPGLRLIDGNLKIDDEISIFSGITGRKYWPESNLTILKEVEGKKIQDSFDHEQCLVINEGDKTALFSGCAHNGILNVMGKYEDVYAAYPDIVISGFHMMKPTPHSEKEKNIIRKTAFELSKYPSKYYTGHCTGQPAFEIMKAIMGDRLESLYTGMRITVPDDTATPRIIFH